MSEETWTCVHHGTAQPTTGDARWCPSCLAEIQNAPDPETMTGDERAAELARREYLTVPFDLIHARIEALVGRPVWTHEMGLAWEALIAEARAEGPERGRRLTPEQLAEPLIDAGVAVVIVDGGKGADDAA